MLFIFRALGRLLTVFYLIAHPLVPRRFKLALLFLPLYLIWPRDLIPDFASGIGHIDDLLMILIGLSVFKYRAGRYVRRSDNDGPGRENRTISTSFRDVDETVHDASSPTEGRRHEFDDDSM